jgi:hypothetical protein
VRFTAHVWLNLDSRFGAYRATDRLATDNDLWVTVRATTPTHAADQVYEVGNRMSADAYGYRWPADVRSLSVGDVLDLTTDAGPDQHTWLACASAGWDLLPAAPPNPTVPLAGTDATSRTGRTS